MPLTIETLTTLIVGLIAIAGAIWRMWSVLDTKIALSVHNLAEFKLEVAKSYASMEHIKDVELRLVDAINKLADSVEQMPSRVAEILKSAQSARSGK
jgi:hypothetical protein